MQRGSFVYFLFFSYILFYNLASIIFCILLYAFSNFKILKIFYIYFCILFHSVACHLHLTCISSSNSKAKKCILFQTSYLQTHQKVSARSFFKYNDLFPIRLVTQQYCGYCIVKFATPEILKDLNQPGMDQTPRLKVSCNSC